MLKNKIKGLVFDLDGVITETADIHFLAWKEELKKLGINFTKQENSILKGLSRIDTLIGILKIHKKLDSFTKVELFEIASKKNIRYKELLNSNLKKGEYLPGIKELLDDAKERGIKLAIASSSHNAPTILKKIGLFKMFDFIVDPKDVRIGKPSPEIFLKACKGIGIKPNEAIGFEDAIAGIQGLVKANIYAVAITHGEPNKWEIAQQVYKSTKELSLEKILRRKNV